MVEREAVIDKKLRNERKRGVEGEIEEEKKRKRIEREESGGRW